MPVTSDRPVSMVFHDIVSNLQTFVRSEVRLAKAEIREEASRTKAAALMLGGGAATALLAAVFLLLAAVFALMRVVPAWEAALIVGAALAMVAGVVLGIGKKRIKAIHASPAEDLDQRRKGNE